ncbi:MAG: hypothetical protein LBM78_02430 [Clostridiales bacterium]|jgi:hypothetical protein|nr:hypothetical protein [Clostridiales bacterium]
MDDEFTIGNNGIAEDGAARAEDDTAVIPYETEPVMPDDPSDDMPPDGGSADEPADGEAEAAPVPAAADPATKVLTAAARFFSQFPQARARAAEIAARMGAATDYPAMLAAYAGLLEGGGGVALAAEAPDEPPRPPRGITQGGAGYPVLPPVQAKTLEDAGRLAIRMLTQK